IYDSGERWRVVIDDGPTATLINGHWDNVQVNDGSSLFLTAHEQDVLAGVDTNGASYDEADVVLNRAAFNDTTVVPSLLHNKNELAVATGLENSFSTSLTGPYGDFIQALEF